jgi:hypothetical protein
MLLVANGMPPAEFLERDEGTGETSTAWWVAPRGRDPEAQVARALMKTRGETRKMSESV